MKPLLHLFNPGHETAVLSGSPHYTPPANVQRMTRELALLPFWYATPHDYVWAEADDSEAQAISSFLSGLPPELGPFPTVTNQQELLANGKSFPPSEAAPWGLSPQSVFLFQELKRKRDLPLAIPEWKAEFVRLTGRQTAAACLETMRAFRPEFAFPLSPVFCRSWEEVEHHLATEQPPFLVKTPYSSSGRGLLWLPEGKVTAQDRQWIEGAIRRQGCVSIERALERIRDFAVEFYSDGAGGVHSVGFSLFGTEAKGNYSGNFLGSQASLKRVLTEIAGEELLDAAVETARQAVEKTYGALYRGYLGVDMLVYRRQDESAAIHPCIEINMRYTMGMVALKLSERFLAPGAQGNFFVTFDPSPGEACRHHASLQAAHPLECEEGKIKRGYLSLCPVHRGTKFRAYLSVV